MLRAPITRDGVLNAVAEFEALGRAAFLVRYGFSPARDYFLVNEGIVAAVAVASDELKDSRANQLAKLLFLKSYDEGVSLPGWASSQWHQMSKRSLLETATAQMNSLGGAG